MADKSGEAFEERLQAHQGIVFKVAHLYCRDPDERADLVQDIAVQLWRAWPSYRHDRPFSTWMYRVALNVAISFSRDRARRQALSQPFDDRLLEMPDPRAVEPEAEAEQQLALLQAFLSRQAPLDRALLMLYLEGRGQREIGEILGLGESNVSTKINRLKQRLRRETRHGPPPNGASHATR